MNLNDDRKQFGTETFPIKCVCIKCECLLTFDLINESQDRKYEHESEYLWTYFIFSTLHHFSRFSFFHQIFLFWTKHKFHQTFIQLLTFIDAGLKPMTVAFQWLTHAIRQLLNFKFIIIKSKKRRDRFFSVYVWWSVGQWVRNHKEKKTGQCNKFSLFTWKIDGDQ